MNPKISVLLNDGLADVYAFATLYDFMVEKNFDADLTFFYDSDYACDFFKKLIQSSLDEKISVPDFFRKPEYIFREYDAQLAGFSDLTSGTDSRKILIDLSILKNCVEPISENERKELRKKHDISLEEKVLVIGFPRFCEMGEQNMKKLIIALHSEISIYLVGDTHQGENCTPRKFRSSIKNVNSHGVLRDYYAMADIALINHNVVRNYRTMHNFIEATAGGPLFLVPPKVGRTAQYGYKQLVNRKVIREARSVNDLISQIKEYLENPAGEEIREQRKQHLEHSRELYLNDLLKLINKFLRRDNKPFESDLLFVPNKYSASGNKVHLDSLKVIHPETIWNPYQTDEESIPIRELNDKNLSWRSC